MSELLDPKLMEFLKSAKPELGKIEKKLLQTTNIAYGCAMRCSGSCSGGCDEGCSGDCLGSCMGGCRYGGG